MIIGKHKDDVRPFVSCITWEQKGPNTEKGETKIVHEWIQDSRPCRFGQAWEDAPLRKGWKLYHSAACMLTCEGLRYTIPR